MDLNSLRLFVEAAQAGSLSEAARRTGVPLPTLSRRVRALEDELGTRLLDRSTRGLQLTHAGARLFADADPALVLLSQAEQRLHDAGGVSGTLRISVPPHFEPLWPILEDFRDRFPHVRFDVFVTDRRVDLVADGIDVVIRVGEGGHESYVGRTLARYRHKLVAAPSLVAGVLLGSPEDLLQFDCACWRGSGAPAWRLGEETVRLDPILTTNDYQHLLQLAVRGRAVTEAPPFLVHELLRDGHLVEVLPHLPLPRQAVRVLVTDTRLLSPLVRQFLDVVAKAAPGALDPPLRD